MFDVGEQVGAYTIVRRLGAGGMGEVYLGRHRHIGREAAIKVLLPELSKNDDVVARFFTEARATAAIRHPGIVEILDCDIHRSGRAYIVMEFLDGENLAERLARAGNYAGDLRAGCAILAHVASAVGAAHAKGIVHRDLKPDNVFLCGALDRPGDGSVPAVKILDFGIAKLVTDDGQGRNKTRTGSLLGTPTYMSPEQCRGAANIDHRTDIYALGCMAFEMFAGRPPFVRDGAGEVLVAHLMEKPPTLSSLVPGIAPGLDALVGRTLEKDAAARPQSMAELVSAFEELSGVRAPGANLSGLIRVPGQTPAPGTPIGQITPIPSGPAPQAVSAPVVSGPVIAGGTRVMQASRTTLSDTASEAAERHAAPRRGRPRWVLPAGIAGGAGAVVAILVVVLGGSPPPPAPAPAPPVREAVRPPPPAPPPPAPKLPAEVTIEVASDPPGAEVWLPGEEGARGQTPLKMRVRRGDPPVRLTLKAAGYNDTPVTLDPAREETGPINVALEKAKRERKRGEPRVQGTPGSGEGKRSGRKDDDHYKPMGD